MRANLFRRSVFRLPAPISPIAHPDDRAAIERAFEELLAGIQPYNIEYRISRQDNGEVRIAQSFGELKRDGEGRPVKVWGASQDLTERRRAEKALGASEVFLRNVLDSSLCGVYVYDLKRGTHCFINQRYTVLTGYALERIRSMDAQDCDRERRFDGCVAGTCRQHGADAPARLRVRMPVPGFDSKF